MKFREKKLAHAYLIETNNIDKLIIDLKKLITVINCPHEYQEDCHKCNLCNLITKNNLPNLITIEPDGQMIKKAQIEDLKTAFETKPIYSKYNIYLIKNAEKLNGSSANAMLKFLEEPNEGILGFFLTNNKDIIMPTIKSRCQTLVVNYQNDNLLASLNITESKYLEYQEIIKNYLSQLKTANVFSNKEIVLTKLPERNEVEVMFKIIFEIYHNHFLKNLNKPYDIELTKIYQTAEKNPIIIKKLNIIAKFLQNLRYNVNMELLLDKFIIEMRNIDG